MPEDADQYLHVGLSIKKKDATAPQGVDVLASIGQFLEEHHPDWELDSLRVDNY